MSSKKTSYNGTEEASVRKGKKGDSEGISEWPKNRFLSVKTRKKKSEYKN